MSDVPAFEHAEKGTLETTSLDAVNIDLEAGASEPPQPTSPAELARLTELKRLIEEQNRSRNESN